MREFFLFGALLGAVFLTGCVQQRFEYIPPAGGSGAECARKCEEDHEICRAQEGEVWDECAGSRFPDRRSFEQCEVARGNVSADCLAPPACPLPDLDGCREVFDACWRRCGGDVRLKGKEE
ncbi:MAG: hypothetical protein EOM26_00215 [Alphaproteobacteria bacterium]|nr:hypothetical protein [Alphaproteobacteria bacterium]